jgi:hypothetical protein
VITPRSIRWCGTPPSLVHIVYAVYYKDQNTSKLFQDFVSEKFIIGIKYNTAHPNNTNNTEHEPGHTSNKPNKKKKEAHFNLPVSKALVILPDKRVLNSHSEIKTTWRIINHEIGRNLNRDEINS